ncbi:amidohydrolase [Christiangramia salexigens]|uniref:Amidohydrolase n=2 Tax=Christiangramia salexigens TaxID=1913577 RepID=A0A1L3J8D8_9FLAO|nr:amidohydrolase [Christiangramia salexigens]
MMNEILALRKELHANPELSGNEINTARRIKDFISLHSNAEIIDNIGGNGLAAVFEFSKNGPQIMIRCELDALPIQEKNDFKHRSCIDGISHKCGHDGHMSIVAGLIFWLRAQTFDKGQVVLLFQPAEETGKGAHQMLTDKKFDRFSPDFVFALHNLPGKPLNSVILKKEFFSATVKSMFVKFTGKEAHASEPENGNNPALAISKLIAEFSKLNTPEPSSPEFSILTPVHFKMGDRSYGISPASAELHYTIRAWSNPVMEELMHKIKTLIAEIADAHKLKQETDWFEYFPEVKNDAGCNEIIEKAANKNGLKLLKEDIPFRFGEDFGWYSKNYPAAMFGLGAGENSPALHHADYDFPDEILESGINMFQTMIEDIFT